MLSRARVFEAPVAKVHQLHYQHQDQDRDCWRGSCCVQAEAYDTMNAYFRTRDCIEEELN